MHCMLPVMLYTSRVTCCVEKHILPDILYNVLPDIFYITLFLVPVILYNTFYLLFDRKYNYDLKIFQILYLDLSMLHSPPSGSDAEPGATSHRWGSHMMWIQNKQHFTASDLSGFDDGSVLVYLYL